MNWKKLQRENFIEKLDISLGVSFSYLMVYFSLSKKLDWEFYPAAFFFWTGVIALVIRHLYDLSSEREGFISLSVLIASYFCLIIPPIGQGENSISIDILFKMVEYSLITIGMFYLTHIFYLLIFIKPRTQTIKRAKKIKEIKKTILSVSELENKSTTELNELLEEAIQKELYEYAGRIQNIINKKCQK